MIQQRWLWIDHITISGNAYLTVDQLTQPVRTVLAKKRWWFFPQRSYLFVDTTAIYNEITATLGTNFALEQLVVDKQFADTIQITVVERVPGLVYIIGQTYYYIDQAGVITQAVAQAEDLDPHFPRIRDLNTNRGITVNQLVVKPEVVDFIIHLNGTFTDQLGFNISEYTLLPVSCLEKQFVAEQLLADDISETTDPVLQEKKRAVLEQLQNDTISVDESLQQLEQLKQQGVLENQNTAGTNSTFIQLQPEYIATDCDFTRVIRDVAVVTQEGPSVYFDTTVPIQQQLNNVAAVKASTIPDLTTITYIDARYPDRVYFD